MRAEEMVRCSPMRRLAWLIWLVVTFGSIASAAPDPSSSPEGAVRRAMSKLLQLSREEALQSPKAKAMFIGEALQWQMSTFGKLSEAADKIVVPGRDAVCRVQRLGANDFVGDVYFYFKNAGGWKVSGVRTLALTGIVEELVKQLEAKKELTEGEAQALANSRMVLATDAQLTKWFHEHRSAFEKIRDEALRIPTEKSLFLRAEGDASLELTRLLRGLHVTGRPAISRKAPGSRHRWDH